jgi:GTP-binding protein
MELKPVPMVSVSALTGQRVQAIISLAMEIKQRMEKKIPGAEFEDTVFEWFRTHPHPAIPENPVRLLGARQVPAPFPLFKFFVTNHKDIAPAYERYITNKIYETWGFEGCPIILEFNSITRSKNGHQMAAILMVLSRRRRREHWDFRCRKLGYCTFCAFT